MFVFLYDVMCYDELHHCLLWRLWEMKVKMHFDYLLVIALLLPCKNVLFSNLGPCPRVAFCMIFSFQEY